MGMGAQIEQIYNEMQQAPDASNLTDAVSFVQSMNEKHPASNKSLSENILTGITPAIEWLNNAMTGNRDYARQIELMNIQNNYNAAEALKNREWQEHMSNTSYQRAAADAAAAGFNPALIMGNGGASTPGGSAAHNGTPGYGANTPPQGDYGP